MSDFYEKESLIAKEQHGFVKRKSCVTNLLELDLITKSLSEGFSVVIVYLDFIKAFDMVPHQRLIQKLKGYGIKDDLLKWVQSFLSERRQRVVLGDISSSWANVTSGVPQGSVLGPLMFVMFKNDLPEVIEGFCKLYADDSKIIRVIEDDSSADILQRDIDSVTNWTKEWLMKLNSSKCKVMHFGNKNARSDYFIDDLSTGQFRGIRM